MFMLDGRGVGEWKILHTLHIHRCLHILYQIDGEIFITTAITFATGHEVVVGL